MRAAVYARVSELKGREETSVANQERAARAFCEARGWEVAKVFSDTGYSAFSGRDRPGWLALEQAVRASEVGAVVVFAVSRAARNTVRLLQFAELCAERGVELHSISEPISGAYGKVFLTLLGAFAELESETKSARTRLWHEGKRAAGEWAGGRIPYGYASDGNGGLVVVPDEAEEIREAVSQILAGASLTSIVKAWNAMQGRQWSRKTLRGLLGSQHLAGLKGGKRAAWPAILTRRDHERLVALFDGRSGDNQPTILSRRYLLTGLLHCGKCGAPMRGRPDRGRPKYICLETGKVHMSVDGIMLDTYVTYEAMTCSLTRQEVADPSVVDQSERDAILAELEELAAIPGLIAGEWKARRAPLVARLEDIDRRLDESAVDAAQMIQDMDVRSLDKLVAMGDPLARSLLEQLTESITIGPGRRGATAFDPERVSITWRTGVEEQPEYLA